MAVQTPIINQVAPSFSLELRAQRASKVDAAAYGRSLSRLKGEKAVDLYARLAFAKILIEEGMNALKAEVMQQVREGNSTNLHGAKFSIASGRTSFDFSNIPAYITATERLEAAREKQKALADRLAAQGKGKVTISPESLRVSIA